MGTKAAGRKGPAEPLWRMPPPGGIAALGALAVALLLAPPKSNWVWAINGFRSVTPLAEALVILGAVATVLLARSRWSRPLAWWALAIPIALLLSFTLREHIHMLGDTDLRIRAIAGLSYGVVKAPIAEWSKRLHTSPLDLGVDFLLPAGIHALGPTILYGVSLVSLFLGLAYFAGAWRVSGRLSPPPGTRVALGLALVLSGALQAFAGYAESAGLMLAAAVWWWAELLAPLDSPRQGARTAAAWLVFFLAHRVALVMLLPQLWRALGPALPGDVPGERRRLLLWTAAAMVLGAAFSTVGSGASLKQTIADFGDLLRIVRTPEQIVPASDLLNVLVLVAPLALVAPWLAWNGAMREYASSPASLLMIVAALPLIPLGVLAPSALSGLGAQRDWDLNALLGWTLTLWSCALLVRLPAGRLRGALAFALPVLTLLAFSWIAVNANEKASVDRALVLASQPPPLSKAHRSHLLAFLGQRAMDYGNPTLAARYYEESFNLNPNPRQALLAAETWGLAGDMASARRMLERVRERGSLEPMLESAYRGLDSLVQRIEADSARRQAARAAAPGGTP